MRKLKYLASVIAILFLGVGTSFLWSYFVPVNVSLCDLAHHRDWFDKRIVRVAAAASGVGEGIIVGDSRCDLSYAMAVIILAQGYVPKPEIEAFLQPSGTESEPQIRSANVVVIGRFDKHATMGCFSPEFGIRAFNPELKSNVLVEPLALREK
ncbi:MAG: hypothetical protein WAL47_16960 [Pyrinomonadaceae bacterium]